MNDDARNHEREDKFYNLHYLKNKENILDT
jgi:hypothetical protein